MKRITVVQIGVGHDHAKPNFESIAALTDVFYVAGFVRVPGEEHIKPDFNSAYPQIPELSLEEAFSLPDLEAAVIETTDMELVQYARMAADKGLHIFMDKAGSQSAEEFEAMLASVYAHKKVFGMGYVLRFHPLIQKALQLAKQGKLGDVYAIEAHMSRDDNDSKRKWLEQFQGGMTYFLGCHLIDQVYAFLGTPEEIIPLNASTTPEKNSAQDLGLTAFRYPNGVSFVKVCGAEPGGYARRQMVICGSLGTLEIRPFEENHQGMRISEMRSWYRNTPDTPLNWDDKGTLERCEPFNRYSPMFEEFARRIREDQPSEKEELVHEARLHRIILAACGMPCDFKGEISL